VERHLPTFTTASQNVASMAMLFDTLPAIDVSYVAPQAHRIVNVAPHWDYSSGLVFIFSQGSKDLYHV
jgi:hypothetical protein